MRIKMDARHATYRAAAIAWLLTVAIPIVARAQQDDVKPPTRSPRYEKHVFTSKDGAKLNYWLMSPKVEEGKTYPLVLALHGRGGNTEAAAVLASDEMREMYPCYVLAPAVSRSQVWAVPASFGKLRGKAMLPAALEALESVKEKYPIDADRVYVTGQSMGGFGSFGAIAASPETFAAAIPICGGWAPADAEKMKHVALWVFHGDADGTVPIENSRKMIAAVKEAGGSPKFTEYPGVGHNSWSKTYASPETWTWLFAQKRQK
ncbi:MAG: prolyl oligopeptidase family serine peptidase [Pirellulaceae bacterium]